MSKTASQKLLRDLNQRIGQIEHEKSLMAEYNGRLEQQLSECRQVSNAHCLQADNYRVQLAELRERVEELEEVGGTKIAELEAELAELKKQ